MDVGARLRMVRTRFGLSQRELAKRAGVTNGTISLIEQNRVSPSVSSLKKVLEGLPITLAEFFTFDAEPSQPRVFYQADELPNLGNEDINLMLVGTSHDKRDIAILRERYLPGADTGPDMLVHDGQEGGVIIRGSIEVTVGNESRVLGPGDAYYFDSKLPHRFRNVGDDICEMVSASSPPTF
ncbi:cupin domain-containing protein [Chromobacterium subtsugae]|uniref:Cupin domain-containing protein n=2 Tax=Pseudomonadota TaxID=1224 RepID=A0ABS7FCZ4_9NEIS|nr:MULTISPECIES: cupin domain-containing protein [Chromobacterium]KUM03205.1 XRE family transcriptional regulator [Chromobacterium subtsugae]KZE88276.1 XRE family transcriptional regulator [Chromobacterium sp. F49]MBW7565543.1 cupin domain-containing protein [Chromobacterium subtsugae]MBW8287872.1 cupin domain-containing protein [Chromobacterium subtsugae]OBU86972.1 XRE family transcriptional regulator [Chromobacterium subtsugae]